MATSLRIALCGSAAQMLLVWHVVFQAQQQQQEGSCLGVLLLLWGPSSWCMLLHCMGASC